ncbi:MAG: hypothetical protein ABW005_07385, partial [Burkholderiaceae bacterium]
ARYSFIAGRLPSGQAQQYKTGLPEKIPGRQLTRFDNIISIPFRQQIPSISIISGPYIHSR